MGIYEGKIEREREREREREITWDFLDLGHNSNSRRSLSKKDKKVKVITRDLVQGTRYVLARLTQVNLK
jgi:hypothetical protein